MGKVLIILGFILGIVFFIMYKLYYHNEFIKFNDGVQAKIKYSCFKDLYFLNPDRWTWGPKTVNYLLMHNPENRIIRLFYNARFTGDPTTMIGFETYSDYMKFQKFLNERNKEQKRKKYMKERQANDKFVIKMLEIAQKDIEKIKRESEKEIADARSMMEEVQERWQIQT